MALASRLLTLGLVFATCGAAAAQRTPDEALRALQDGNRRFAAEKSVLQPTGEGIRRTLSRGQSPFAIVLCCADSRVPPEHVFNAGLGELFVVRVAGHACDAETLASIEYAVDHLNVPLCVVLGHESCGAVAACIAQVAAEGQGHAGEHSPAIQNLLEQIEPAVRKARARDLGGKELHDASEEEHAHVTVQECMRRSALLRRHASLGRFRMVAARYHLQSGEVEWLPNRSLPAEPLQMDHATPGTVAMNVPPHVALRMLQAGHRRFLSDGRPAADLTAQRREALTHGQQPSAIVLTCADSRVAPEHVFDAGLGELFVIRIAGNTLNDDALASIEYAAAHTGASLLVVMGHTACGAVKAASEQPDAHDLSPNLRALLTRLEPAVAQVRGQAQGRDLVDLAVAANALRTVAEARSRSALLRRLEEQGRFAMLPVVYDIASGDLHWLKDAREGDAAAPPAAPHGETMAPGGEHDDAHGADAQHTRHEAAKEHEVPVLEWANHVAPNDEAPHRMAEGALPEHAAEHGVGDDTHQATAPHAVPGHGPAVPSAHAGSEAPKGGRQWTDPTVLVGMTGVVSLLLAVVLAVKKRG